jgi:hypothetical protein
MNGYRMNGYRPDASILQRADGLRGRALPSGRLSTMPTWKPHALAKPHADQLELRANDKVRSTLEMPGVPLGTAGKVLLANGFNWLRYRVLFDNGVEVGDLDSRQLEPIGRTAKRLAKAAAKAG